MRTTELGISRSKAGVTEAPDKSNIVIGGVSMGTSFTVPNIVIKSWVRSGDRGSIGRIWLIIYSGTHVGSKFNAKSKAWNYDSTR